MTQSNKVPWSKLFPGILRFSESMRRKNGTRYYRVKLKLPFRKFNHVKARLEPYGFEVKKYHYAPVMYGGLVESIVCIKRTKM